MSDPTDSYFGLQWYLARDHVTWGNGSNVWDTYGYTGAGVKVGVLDNGVQVDHPDLDANYDPTLSFGADGRAMDHGTAVSGVIAAERNGIGVVGIAYDAKIGSVPVWGKSFATDADYIAYTSSAFAKAQSFDVVNQSWNHIAFDQGQHIPTRQVVLDGMESDARYGRDGLGTIFVSAAGNSRSANQAYSTTSNPAPAGDANVCGPTVESRYAIVVAGVRAAGGAVADYSSPGANVLVSAGADGTWTDNSDFPIWTTDRSGTAGYVDGDYVSTVGTSFSSPQVTGIVALMLQANPNLGYRDVQQILAITARHTGSDIPQNGTTVPLTGAEKFSWAYNHTDTWNAGGMHFSNDYGFGMVDARAAVLMAETWPGERTSFNEVNTSATVNYPNGSPLTIPDANIAGVNIQFQLGGHLDMEQVTVDLGLHHTFAGDLTITLTSPSGTKATLLDRVGGTNEINDWSFNANAFRGEDSAGTWTLNIADKAGSDVGTLTGATLTAYGSAHTEDGTYYFTDEFGQNLNVGNDLARTYVSGGAGIDTVNAAAVDYAMVLDLNPTKHSSFAGKDFIVANMENAVGGEQDDTILGNDAANWLRGGRGNDTISGGAGDDILQGDRGYDTLDGGADNDTIIVSTTNDDHVSGGTGRDELTWDSAFGQSADLTGTRIYFIENGSFRDRSIIRASRISPEAMAGIRCAARAMLTFSSAAAATTCSKDGKATTRSTAGSRMRTMQEEATGTIRSTVATATI